MHGQPLVYLDNAATAQRPRAVLEAMRSYYEEDNANVHRAIHTLSQRATDRFDRAREVARRFLNAASEREILFTKGCTEGINLVAQCYARVFLKEGDLILVSGMEHHSNIVPWQLAAEATGARIRPIPITDAGEIDRQAYRVLLEEGPKLVALVHVSNALGTVNPVRELVAEARAAGATTLIDGAQGAPHVKVDVQEIGADFYAVSGHKLYGPTGIGVLYGREELLERMPPYQGGGDMIRTVSFEGSTWNMLPNKFEAGTPNIAGAIGLAAAMEYVESVGYPAMQAQEQQLLERATAGLQTIRGVRIYGNAPHKTGVLSFTMDAAHPHDIGTILESEAVAIRAGHHCTQPLMARYGLSATARASLTFYNTEEEVDRFLLAVHKVNEVFGG